MIELNNIIQWDLSSIVLFNLNRQSLDPEFIRRCFRLRFVSTNKFR